MADDLIERYLDRLYPRLPADPRRARRLLAETEAHLRDATDAGVAAGQSRDDAARAAIARFGEPSDVAPPVTTGAVLHGLTWLVAVGLTAVGVSGLVAAVMTAAFGPAFVGGVGDLGLSPAACGHLFAVQPGAADCASALTRENADDAVTLRVLVGLVGLVVFGVLAVLRRTRRPATVPSRWTRLAVVATFGVAGLFLLGASADLVAVGHPDGIGFFLSGGLVAAALAAGAGVRLRLQR